MEVPRVVVGVLVYNDRGEVLLATSHKWKGRWIVIGGHLDWGETIEDAVRRETREETGLKVSDIEMVCFQESIFPDEYHDKRHFVFLDFSCRMAGGDVRLNHELQKHVWVKPEEALKLDLNKSTRIFIEEFIRKRKDR